MPPRNQTRPSLSTVDFFTPGLERIDESELSPVDQEQAKRVIRAAASVAAFGQAALTYELAARDARTEQANHESSLLRLTHDISDETWLILPEEVKSLVAQATIKEHEAQEARTL